MKKLCPACDADITIPDDSMTGEVYHCSDCGESFELDEKMNLKIAETVSEDWGE